MKKCIIVIVALIFSFISVNMVFATPNTWTQKANFGGTARSGAVGFSIGSKGYIGTGSDNSGLTKDFWEYDPGLNAWTQMADFGGTARLGAVGFSIGSKGYIGTGEFQDDFTLCYDAESCFAKDVWEYYPGLNTWTQKTDFGGTARYSAVGFSIGNKGYIGTGSNGAYYPDPDPTDPYYPGAFIPTYYSDFWEYDPDLDAWTQKADYRGKAQIGVVGFSIGSRGFIGTGFNVSVGAITGY